ncbi:MAG: TIGR00730 family Rossman fold protein [Ilumatobacteraceae bacterium]
MTPPNIDELLDGMDLGRNRRLARQLLDSAFALLADHPDVLDLKIASAALEEMREAFKMFAAFRDIPKVTIFGSARTQMADPLYMQARDVATRLADAGWMVVTGAGPGIMQAGMEGAGREKSIGVSIRLPFEQGANSVIAGDLKYVSMKYFFTRKLMLIKESTGFVCLPGGFGTLDETFELLTLTQTGKGLPVPIVLLDTPGDPYWETVDDFVRHQLVDRGLVAAADTELYLVTDDSQAAVNEVIGFYRNYDSIRYVGNITVMRLRKAPTDAQLALLNEKFGHLAGGGIVRATPFEPERRENDNLDLSRIAFTFSHHSSGALRSLIDMVNSFVDERGAAQ